MKSILLTLAALQLLGLAQAADEYVVTETFGTTYYHQYDTLNE